MPIDPSKTSLGALDWLNFFLADVQTGIGPFLAVYLAAQHWNAEQVGIALTCGGLAGVLAQAPGGALVDATHRKRLLLTCAIVLLVGAALILAICPTIRAVIGAQILLGSVGSLLAPVVTAITLGMVTASVFDKRFGRNQTFNAAGNVVAALLMGAVGYLISNRAIFYAVPFLAIPSLIALSAIDPNEVDYARARGASEDRKGARAAGIRTLISNRPLSGFAVCAVLFHFANAAMLPQLGEMLAHGRARESALFMSACVVVTQLVISLTAASIGKMAAVWGRKPLLMIGFGILPIRGVLYTLTSSVPLLIGIQLLDGVANAIFGVVSVLVVADLTRGTGRFNVTQGVLGAAVGIGASVSTTFAGYLVQHSSYSVSFLSLAGIAFLACILLWAIVPETLPLKAINKSRVELRHER